jgi:hypothetical protein
MKGALDLMQFAGIQLGQLGSHLFAAGLESDIGRIAGSIAGFEVAQTVQFVGQLLPDVRTPTQQGFMQSQ